MIKALVEGQGDVLSLPILVRKSKQAAVKIDCLDMLGKSNIVRMNDGFEKTMIRQIELGYKRFYILLDADVFFAPYENYTDEVAGMTTRVNEFKTSRGVEVTLFWAIKAYESWLIGGLKKGDHFCGLHKTIRGIPGDTQTAPADPKKWIRDHRSDNRYNPDVQVCLTRHINLGLAQRRNDSLRTFLDRI